MAEQMRAAGTIRRRDMFGEYAVWLRGRVVALVCGGQPFVRRTPGAVPLLPDPQIVPPFPGAKP
jgi:TfoX/Sxy family transcriptional regulator of competence genes